MRLAIISHISGKMFLEHVLDVGVSLKTLCEAHNETLHVHLH